MKINIDIQVLCCDRSDYRGIQYYTIELIKALVKRGNHNYSVSFFDYNKERGNRFFVEQALSEIIEKLEVYECNELDYRKVIDGIRKNDASAYSGKSYGQYVGVDADIFFFPDGTRLPWNVPIGKTVVTVHDVIPLLGESINGLSEDFILRFKNSMDYIASRKDIKIISDSESSKNDLIDVVGVESERIEVIYAAYQQERFYQDINQDVLKKYGIEGPYILYLGALAPHKGVDTLIKAAGILDSEASVVLAGGKTPEYDVETEIAGSSAKDRIIMTGFVSEEEKRVLYSCASVFVFPSRYEGFGLPVLEAMACGTPVITTNTSSIPEVGGDAAVYIEPGDAKQLAQEISRFLLNTKLRDEYSCRGMEQAGRFTWDKTAILVENEFINHNKK